MNMKKKMLVALFVLVFVFTLSACTRNDDDEHEVAELLDDIEQNVRSWRSLSYHRMLRMDFEAPIIESKHINEDEGLILMRAWVMDSDAQDPEKDTYWIYVEDGFAYIYYYDLFDEKAHYTTANNPEEFEDDLPDAGRDLSNSIYIIRRALSEDYYDTTFEEYELDYDRETGEFDLWAKVNDRGTTREWRAFGDREKIHVESPYQNVGDLIFEKTDYFADFDKTEFFDKFGGLDMWDTD